MSRQDDIDVGNLAEYKAERYSAASAGYKSAVQSAKNMLAVGQACTRCGQSPDTAIYMTSTHSILVSDLLAMAQFSGDL